MRRSHKGCKIGPVKRTSFRRLGNESRPEAIRTNRLGGQVLKMNPSIYLWLALYLKRMDESEYPPVFNTYIVEPNPF